MPVKGYTYRLRAILVLVVFGISLMPRQVLHNFVTNHKHVKWTSHQGQAQVSAETFSCSADNLFLQQTYNNNTQLFTAHCPVLIAPGHDTFVCLRDSDDMDLSFLRGPPSIV